MYMAFEFALKLEMRVVKAVQADILHVSYTFPAAPASSILSPSRCGAASSASSDYLL
jgi:hypothetical protein